MRKISKFWKVYIFAVTVAVILSVGLLLAMTAYLKGYEVNAAEKRKAEAREAEISRAYESESEAARLAEEKNMAELEVGSDILMLDNMKDAVSAAAAAAEKHVILSVDSSPERVMETLIASLRHNGIRSLEDVLVCSTGKYESRSSVIRYLDGLPGEYSYEKLSELEYRLRKDEKIADIKLSVQNIREDGHKVYGVASAEAEIPLFRIVVEAPEGAVITANGKTVDDAPELTVRAVPDYVPKKFKVPSVARYELRGFIYEPELEAVYGGSECVKIRYEDKISFLTPSSDIYKTELNEKIFTLCFAYSDFVAGARDFNSIKPVLYPGTKLYDGLSGFDNRWYYNFDHITNADARISYFTVWSENLVSAHVEYTQELRSETDRVNFRIKIPLDVYIGCDDASKGKDADWRLISVESR